jgi:methyl-accepting chemotaxis protein
MGIEWFRDLSITVLGFTTVAMLVFLGIVVYSLYRKITVTLVQTQTLIRGINDIVKTVEETVKSTSQNINDTIAGVKDSVKQVSRDIGDTFTRIQDRIKPLLPILALIQGITEGIKSIKSLFKKETVEGEMYHE